MAYRQILSDAIKSIKNSRLFRATSAIIQYPLRAYLHRIKLNKVLRNQSIEERFTTIYRLNFWDSDESVSGVGSTLEYTAKLRKDLPILFERFSIRSIFDAGCGDVNWILEVINECQLQYIGGDIVLPIIEENNIKYSSPSVKFIHLDLTKDKFPDADMIICRDCLFHLSYRDTFRVLSNLMESNINYLLTTTHTNRGSFVNRDISTGDFRHIDLFAAPYNFPSDVLFRISERQRREMCLWSREQIGSVIKGSLLVS